MIRKTRILFIALFIFSNMAFAQSKWDKMIGKAEASYTTGDYAKANKYLAKFYKKSTKKLGKENEYTPTYHTLLAKYKLAGGQLLTFEASVQNAINSSIAVNKEDSKKHGLLLMDIAELYNQNGAYRQAIEYLNQSKAILDKGANFDKQTEADGALIKRKRLAGRDFIIPHWIY